MIGASTPFAVRDRKRSVFLFFCCFFFSLFFFILSNTVFSPVVFSFYSVYLIFEYLSMQVSLSFACFIFFACGKTAADMPLLLVDVQHPPHLFIQCRIRFFQSVGHIHMYGRFTDSEFLCSGTHGRFVFDDIFTEFNGSLFDNSFQKNKPPCRIYRVTRHGRQYINMSAKGEIFFFILLQRRELVDAIRYFL